MSRETDSVGLFGRLKDSNVGMLRKPRASKKLAPHAQELGELFGSIMTTRKFMATRKDRGIDAKWLLD